MIASFFISIAASVLSLLIGLLPVAHLPTQFSSSLVYFWGIINSFSYVLPVDTLLQVALIVLGVEAFLLLFHIARFIFKHIPLIGK